MCLSEIWLVGKLTLELALFGGSIPGTAGRSPTPIHLASASPATGGLQGRRDLDAQRMQCTEPFFETALLESNVAAGQNQWYHLG